ncbi:MAG: hypothetical protein OQJ97_05725 [Rhodospirillales bacterium]|nr:hypothetical protein [Rhodospirillales bacterium]
MESLWVFIIDTWYNLTLIRDWHMKKISAFIILASMFVLSACDKGPDEIDIRANKFARDDFTEETVRKAIDGFFYVDNFKIKSIAVTAPGVVSIDTDAGTVKEKRVLLLRAAATSYAFTRILMVSDKTQKVSVSFNGSVVEENGSVTPYKVITTEMTKERASEVVWDSVEDAIARDRGFDKALSEFKITQFDKSFEEFVQIQLFSIINEITPQ